MAATRLTFLRASNKNLTAKDARESESQPKDASADNSRQQHSQASKLQAQDNHVVRRFVPLSAWTMTSTSGLPGWFSHVSVTQKGLGQQTAKKTDYNHKIVSPATFPMASDLFLATPSCSADCTQCLLILLVGSFSNGKINMISTPKFLKHLGNFSPGSIIRVVQTPTPEEKHHEKDRQTDRLFT